MPRHFPHLLPEDRELWEDFLELPANVYENYPYEVKVRNRREPGPGFHDHIRAIALKIARSRIDASGVTGTTPTIIAISTTAGLTQLGQLMAYPCLYKIQIPESPEPQRLLVSRSIQTDIEPVLRNERIPFLIVPIADR